MRSATYTKINETIFDIYTERDRLPWHYKAFATLSTWLMLAGYILFAFSVSSNPTNLSANTTVLVTLAGVGLLLGYVGVIMTAILANSLLFIFDGILLPTFTSSAIGLFCTAMNQGLHKQFFITTQAALYVPIITACLSTFVSGALGCVVYYRLRKIKITDQRRRMHVPMDQYSSSLSTTSSQQIHQRLLDIVPDDEQQRRQLMRLLAARDARGPGNEDASSTYKIDLPWDESPGAYRQRSGSLPNTSSNGNNGNNGWGLSKLIPGLKRSDSNNGFKDPREKRREEIERSTMLSPDLKSTSQHSKGWPSAVLSPPAWSQSSRYA